MKLDTKAFALACSILWGSAVFLVTWWVIILDGATGEPRGSVRFIAAIALVPLAVLWAWAGGLWTA